MNNKSPNIFPILTINFIGILGFSIILPFLVFLVEDFGGNGIIYGILSATYPAFQMIGGPILGKFSDIFGRKKVLFFSHLGTFLAWVIFIIALFLPITSLLNIDSKIFGKFVVTIPLIVLFIGRALDGLTGGNVSVANAYLADISTDDNMNKNFGKISISSNLAYMLGPMLGGVLGATVLGELLPVSTAAFISLAGIVIIAVFLKDSNVASGTTNPETEKDNSNEMSEENKDDNKQRNVSLKEVLKIKNVPYFLVMYFILFLAFNIFYASFPVHASRVLEWDTLKLGYFFFVLSALMALVQGPVLSWLSKKVSEGLLIAFGTLMLGINFALLITADPFWTYVAAVCFAIGNGLMWPSFLSVLMKYTDKRYKGTVQGFGSSAGSLASIGGLVVGGFLYEAIGGYTFLVSVGITVIVFFLSMFILKIEKEYFTRLIVFKGKLNRRSSDKED
jgi:MFS family permease